MQYESPPPCRATSRQRLLMLAFGLASAGASANLPPDLPVVKAPPQPTQRMAALETPVDEPRITSPYGWRVHPILGWRRFHNGVDYGAPEGTPVRAAEDGVVESIGRHGNYGLYLRIRHCRTVETAYAHLAGFSPGLHVGSLVSRGEVIASVGHTGWATGPHLYYEVIVNGRRVNPDQPGLLVPVDVTPSLGTQQTAQNGPS